MIDDQLSPEEQTLVEQLRSTSKPQIKSSSREAIRARLLDEFRVVMAQPVPTPHPPHLIRFAYGLVAAIIIAVTVLVIAQTRGQIPQTGSEVTLSPQNPVAVVPSETALPTVTPEPSETATSTSTPTPSPTTVVPSATAIPPSATDTPFTSETASTQAATEVSPTPTTVVPSVTMTATLTPTSTPFTLVVVEGPIGSIVDNIIMVYDFSIEVTPEHPILNLLNTGDIIRVEGTTDASGIVLAADIGNIPSETIVNTGTTATVSLDGPVEAIDGNWLTVNGIQVMVDPTDPVLQNLQVGNFISVEGNFESSGSNIVLMVVNITIVNNVIVGSEPECWFHEGMGMGHWHCDGMGMGMGMGR